MIKKTWWRLCKKCGMWYNHYDFFSERDRISKSVCQNCIRLDMWRNTIIGLVITCIVLLVLWIF